MRVRLSAFTDPVDGGMPMVRIETVDDGDGSWWELEEVEIDIDPDELPRPYR